MKSCSSLSLSRQLTIMKRIIQLLCVMLLSLNTAAQNDTLITKKPVNIWVYSTDGNMVKGVLAGRSGDNLLVYTGKMKRQNTKEQYTLERIPYHNITTIKTKKPNGLLKGLLIGAGIGLAPIVGGQGGAYAAILTFPLGIITGAIVGGTSKKKSRIDKDYKAFLDFTNNYIQ